ncbi:ALP1-like protein [Tanacetum coccineum]
MKCISAIRKMAYRSIPVALDEYLQMGVITACQSFVLFCKAVMKLYGEEFLRKPSCTNIEKLYARHDETHGFFGMIGSIDCTGWQCENCPIALKAQFCKGGHGTNSFILLEAIVSQDLWIWHTFFSISKMNNDVNVLRQSPIFNDIKEGKALDVPIVANGVTYKR